MFYLVCDRYLYRGVKYYISSDALVYCPTPSIHDIKVYSELTSLSQCIHSYNSGFGCVFKSTIIHLNRGKCIVFEWLTYLSYAIKLIIDKTQRFSLYRSLSLDKVKHFLINTRYHACSHSHTDTTQNLISNRITGIDCNTTAFHQDCVTDSSHTKKH